MRLRRGERATVVGDLVYLAMASAHGCQAPHR
jgi:hypothetical protein